MFPLGIFLNVYFSKIFTIRIWCEAYVGKYHDSMGPKTGPQEFLTHTSPLSASSNALKLPWKYSYWLQVPAISLPIKLTFTVIVSGSLQISR